MERANTSPNGIARGVKGGNGLLVRTELERVESGNESHAKKFSIITKS